MSERSSTCLFSLHSSVLQFTPDQVHEFMDRGYFKGNLGHLLHRQAHEQLWRVSSSRKVLHFFVGNCSLRFTRRVASLFRWPPAWRRQALATHKSRETYPFPIARCSPFPTQPGPLGGATSCAEGPGSEAGSSQRHGSFPEHWAKGGLVELIRCHLFPGASPEIHRQQLVRVALLRTEKCATSQLPQRASELTIRIDDLCKLPDRLVSPLDWHFEVVAELALAVLSLPVVPSSSKTTRCGTTTGIISIRNSSVRLLETRDVHLNRRPSQLETAIVVEARAREREKTRSHSNSK